IGRQIWGLFCSSDGSALKCIALNHWRIDELAALSAAKRCVADSTRSGAARGGATGDGEEGNPCRVTHEFSGRWLLRSSWPRAPRRRSEGSRLPSGVAASTL